MRRFSRLLYHFGISLSVKCSLPSISSRLNLKKSWRWYMLEMCE